MTEYWQRTAFFVQKYTEAQVWKARNHISKLYLELYFLSGVIVCTDTSSYHLMSEALYQSTRCKYKCEDSQSQILAALNIKQFT